MPRVRLDPHYNEKQLATKIIGKRKLLGLTQRDIATKLGISQQSYGIKEKTARFTYSELVVLFKSLLFDDLEITKTMKGE